MNVDAEDGSDSVGEGTRIDEPVGSPAASRILLPKPLCPELRYHSLEENGEIAIEEAASHESTPQTPVSSSPDSEESGTVKEPSPLCRHNSSMLSASGCCWMVLGHL